MGVEVTAVDHVYVAVRDLGRSTAFWDPVMRLLGFRKGTLRIGGEPHVHYFNRVTQISLRPAREGERAAPYRVGALHHLCLRVDSREAVDEAWRELCTLGVEATEPALRPEYADDYYATFFEDPDGIRLEIVALRKLRTLVRERWAELTEFEDPVRKAGFLK